MVTRGLHSTTFCTHLHRTENIAMTTTKLHACPLLLVGTFLRSKKRTLSVQSFVTVIIITYQLSKKVQRISASRARDTSQAHFCMGVARSFGGC